MRVYRLSNCERLRDLVKIISKYNKIPNQLCVSYVRIYKCEKQNHKLPSVIYL
jgi:hypothetical protein